MNQEDNNWVIVTDTAEKASEYLFDTEDSVRTDPNVDSFAEFRETWRHAKALARPEYIRMIASGASSPEKWRWALTDIPGENLLIQPPRWGNAAALLLTILEIQKQDPLARVTILPAHYQVESDEILLQAIEQSLDSISDECRGILLGLPPHPADDYEEGWILPTSLRDRCPYSIAFIVDKLSASVSEKMMRRGALWNSSILVASVNTLLLLYMMAEPKIVWPMFKNFKENFTPASVSAAYEFIPSKDFTKNILSSNPHLLKTLPVEDCGWSFLKTPTSYWKALSSRETSLKQSSKGSRQIYH